MNAVSYYKRRHSIHNGEISICYDDDFSSDFIPNDQVNVNGNPVCQEQEIDSPQPQQEQPPRALQMQSPMQLQLPFRWSIENKDVSELPEIYPRLSYPLIIRDSEVSEIGERLWAFLRINDVRSAYDSRQGKVLCCTERVSFVVQFWRRLEQPQSSADVFGGGCDTDYNRDVSHSNSNDISNDSGEEIILEIQRRQGCSWAMHKIRSALKKSILKHPQHNHNQSQSQSHRNQSHRSRRRHSTHTSSSFFPPPFSPLPMMRSHSHAGFSNSHQPSVVFPIPLERGERERSQQHNHNQQHNYQYNRNPNQHNPERTHNFSFSSNPQQQQQQAIPNEVIQQTIPNEVIVPAASDDRSNARSISPAQDDSIPCSRSVSPLR